MVWGQDQGVCLPDIERGFSVPWLGQNYEEAIDGLGHLNEKALHCVLSAFQCLVQLAKAQKTSWTTSSSLPLMDKGISGTAELSVLIANTKLEGVGRGRGLWDDIPGWMRGKNGAASKQYF